MSVFPKMLMLGSPNGWENPFLKLRVPTLREIGPGAVGPRLSSGPVAKAPFGQEAVVGRPSGSRYYGRSRSFRGPALASLASEAGASRGFRPGRAVGTWVVGVWAWGQEEPGWRAPWRTSGPSMTDGWA